MAYAIDTEFGRHNRQFIISTIAF